MCDGRVSAKITGIINLILIDEGAYSMFYLHKNIECTSFTAYYKYL